jgi:hypothetical protein
MVHRNRAVSRASTALYTRVAVSAIGEVTSPLDLLLKMPG